MQLGKRKFILRVCCIRFFSLGDQKMDLSAPQGTIKCTLWFPGRIKSLAIWKNIYFTRVIENMIWCNCTEYRIFKTRAILYTISVLHTIFFIWGSKSGFFKLLGHKVYFIACCGTKMSFFYLPLEKWIL